MTHIERVQAIGNLLVTNCDVLCDVILLDEALKLA